MEKLPKDVLLSLIDHLPKKDSLSLVSTFKTIHKIHRDTHEANISQLAQKWAEEVIIVPSENMWTTAKFFKQQSIVMKWTWKVQQREQPNQELQDLAKTLRITKRHSYNPLDEESEEAIDYQMILETEFQFGNHNIAKIKSWSFDDEGCSPHWNLTWVETADSEKRIFVGGHKQSSLPEMKNMKKLHEFLGLSSSLLDLTKFLQSCLPVPLDTNFAFVEKWPNYDKLKNSKNAKATKPPKSKKQKKMPSMEEVVEGKQSFEDFYGSLGRPLPLHWVKWFCCKASSFYWTLGIQSEWKESTEEQLDEASKQLLGIVKTYKVEHRHRISEQPSSQFLFQVNHKPYHFFWEQVEVEEIKGTLSWIQADNTRKKILELGQEDLILQDSFAQLHKEWNIKCNQKQLGMFLVLCLPYRLFDYEGPTKGGLKYESTRFVRPWLEDEPEEFQMFKEIHNYLKDEEEEEEAEFE